MTALNIVEDMEKIPQRTGKNRQENRSREIQQRGNEDGAGLVNRRPAPERLSQSARDRWHQQHFVTVLK
jgi:hypothetical protein